MGTRLPAAGRVNEPALISPKGLGAGEWRGGEDKDRTRGRKVPVNFRAWKAVLCFACLHSRSMCKLTKQN